MLPIARFVPVVCFAMVFSSACLQAAEASPKPNVLFIFADDQCFDTINALGNKEIITPNLDRLVSRGMTFSHAYNNGSWAAAVCVASRAMLNTGQFVWKANEASKSYASKGLYWSQRMQKAGYSTYMTGKWHLQSNVKSIFQEVGTQRPGMPKDVKSGYNRPTGPDDTEWLPWDEKNGGHWAGGKHWSEVLGDEVCAKLTSAPNDSPLFIYAAFSAPHDPRQSPKRFVDMYPLDKISMPKNFLPKYPYRDAIGCDKNLRDERLAPFPRTEYAVKVNRQEYYAIVTHMDEQIGRILDALDKSGKAENTYIIFTADHGLAVGQHGLMGKQNMFEHSVRAPFIISGPGIKGGDSSSVPIYLQDAMPTALDIAGAGTDGVDFKSLMPLIKGETTKHYEAIYSNYMNLQQMVTQNGFKLIHYPKINTYLLFDLTKDPLEMTDLSKDPAFSDKLEQLKQLLQSSQK